jgi:hypothetical protein
MAEFESPTYVLDLRNKSNCSRIESAKVGKEIQVLVRPENDSMAQPIVAMGILSKDATSFCVVVKTADGEQTHDWGYNDLLEAISAHRPD